MASSSRQPLLESSKTSRSISFWGVLSLAAIICTVAFLAIHLADVDSSPTNLQSICSYAHDVKESCLAIISGISANHVANSNPKSLLEKLLVDSAFRIQETAHRAKLVRVRFNDQREEEPLSVCVELMDLSRDRVMESINALGRVDTTPGASADAHTWLSTVLTNHMTCLEELTGEAKAAMEPKLKDLILRARTALAVFVSAYSSSPMGKKLPFSMEKGFPSWVTSKDRKLLQSSSENIVPDVVVAKDGSGKYTNVSDAVAAAPTNSKTRYVIYIKKGTYTENVQLAKSLKNIMLVGDGMNATIITGSLNVVDGSTTFNSATVAAVGEGFIAQDIWFQNTAGAIKHQAVALRVGSDLSVINRCQIDAYQDTLYAHSNRQFYRDCNVTGTVDFIFGNAAVVFQNCNLIPRKPMDNQANMVTAQGRTDPNQNTATSIQNCSIVASNDLKPVIKSIPSYLGRPWKLYSRTVVMQSFIGDVINPSGWSVWDGDFALDTLYYAEYSNRGPGSNTTNRVKWTGYHIITNSTEVQPFTVAALIQGDTWLNSTGVSFTPGL